MQNVGSILQKKQFIEIRRHNNFYFFKGDKGLPGSPGEKGVKGELGLAGKKVRKYILPHVKKMVMKEKPDYLEVCSGKEFILEESICEYFCQG